MQKVIILSMILVIFTGITLGQVPHLINYQGVLIDSETGQPVPDETYSIEFSIYDVPAGGSAGWTETHSVETTNGFYSVQLGLNTPLTPINFMGPEKYLGIKIDEDPEMTPRKRIVSVAYAIMCEESLNSWDLSGNSGTTAGTNFLGTTDNQPLIFKTNETEALRISTDGNIGLGTTAPSYKLHVTGSVSGPIAHFGNNLQTGTSLQLRVAGQNAPTALTMYTTNAAGSKSGASIDFNGTKVGGGRYNAVRISGFLTDPGTATDGAVTIQTLGGGTLSERVRFQGNGNVGIGTTNPSSKLQVAGTIHSSTGGFKFPDGTTQTTAASGGGGGWTDSGTNVYLTTSTDKVGIGDTSPTHKLDVAGKIGINDTQMLFLPDQTYFDGTLIVGDGGGNLEYSSEPNFGNYNTAIGISALNSITRGYSNTAIGYQTLFSLYNEMYNTAIGYQAAYSTRGIQNTVIGAQALQYGGGDKNTAIGFRALIQNGGDKNTAIGELALFNNDTGDNNMAIGNWALYSNTTGAENTASGNGALSSNTTGNSNTALGYQANGFNQAGSNNTIIGYQAGHGTEAHNKSGNIFIGYQAGFYETGSNKLYIENSDSASPLIGGDFSTNELYLNGNVGIGTSSPGAELDVAGKIKTSQLQVGTSTTAGYVLTADASGNGTWQATTGGGGGWTDGGTNVYLTTSTDKVGIGDTSPTHKLDVAGKIGINDTQVLFLPDQTYFTGTLIVGDGGGSLSYTSGFNGRYNTGIGMGSLTANTTGFNNTASGYQALYSNTIGSSNTASGNKALYSNISGNSNTASGHEALFSNTEGDENTASGFMALYFNITGYGNTANGYKALYHNDQGDYNTASGYFALCSNTQGYSNTASGYRALYSNTTGHHNAASGYGALISNTSGQSNTASGFNALSHNTTGSYNTALGHNADVSTGNLINATAIGFNTEVNASNKVRIGNQYVTVIEGEVAWTASSDSTKKENLVLADGEEILQKLRHFWLGSWNFKNQDPERFRHYGPMAQQFFRAFGNDGVGTVGTDTTICASDIDGINMIAIQALEKRTEELKVKTQELDILKQQMRELKALVMEQNDALNRLRSDLAELNGIRSPATDFHSDVQGE